MSRLTQYIGLNNQATSWLAEHRIEGSLINSYIMTSGLADEPITGKIYQIKYDEELKTAIAKEVVQFIVHSSGPMIFTYLHILDDDNKLLDEIGAWMEDPEVKNEVDYVNGLYFV